MGQVEAAIKSVSDASDAATVIAGSYRDAVGRLRDEHGRFISNATQAAALIAASGQAAATSATQVNGLGQSASGAAGRLLTLATTLAQVNLTTARTDRSILRGAGSLRRYAGEVVALVGSIAQYAEAQELLDRGTQSMGLNFDQAAAAAGRFTTATDVMYTAQTAARAGLHLTQQELDNLAKVAGNFVRPGETVAATMDRMTTAVINGSERGLRQFGLHARDASGQMLTMADRLTEVTTRASHMGTAVATAGDRMRSLNEAMETAKRLSSEAFVEEIARLSALSGGLHGATQDADDLNVKFRAVGMTAAYVVGIVGNAGALMLGILAQGVNTIKVGLVAAVQISTGSLLDAYHTLAAEGDRNSTTSQIAGFNADRLQALLAVSNDGGTGRGPEDGAVTTTRAQMAEQLTARRQAQAEDTEARARVGGRGGTGGASPAARAEQRHVREEIGDIVRDDPASAGGRQLSAQYVEEIRAAFNDPVEADHIIAGFNRQLENAAQREARQGQSAGRRAAHTWLTSLEAELRDHAATTADIVGGHLAEATVAGVIEHFGKARAQQVVDHLNRQIREASDQRLGHLMERSDQRISVPDLPVDPRADRSHRTALDPEGEDELGIDPVGHAQRVGTQQGKQHHFERQQQEREQRRAKQVAQEAAGFRSQMHAAVGDTNRMAKAAHDVAGGFSAATKGLGSFFAGMIHGKATFASFADAMKSTLGKAIADTATSWGELEAGKAAASFADLNFPLGIAQAGAAVALFTAGSTIGALMGSGSSGSTSAVPSAGGGSASSSTTPATSGATQPPPLGASSGAGGYGAQAPVTIVFQGAVLADSQGVAHLGVRLGDAVNEARRQFGHRFVGE